MSVVADAYSQLLGQGWTCCDFVGCGEFEGAEKDRQVELFREAIRRKCRADRIKVRTAVFKMFGLPKGVVALRVGSRPDVDARTFLYEHTGFHVCGIESANPFVWPGSGWRFCPFCGDEFTDEAVAA